MLALGVAVGGFMGSTMDGTSSRAAGAAALVAFLVAAPLCLVVEGFGERISGADSSGKRHRLAKDGRDRVLRLSVLSLVVMLPAQALPIFRRGTGFDQTMWYFIASGVVFLVLLTGETAMRWWQHR